MSISSIRVAIAITVKLDFVAWVQSYEESVTVKDLFENLKLMTDCKLFVTDEGNTLIQSHSVDAINHCIERLEREFGNIEFIDANSIVLPTLY